MSEPRDASLEDDLPECGRWNKNLQVGHETRQALKQRLV